jgi:hypothetical protein
MVVNLMVQSGIVKSPALRYDSNSKPEFRFTLMQQEKDWPLYLPSCAVGSAAECPASEMDDGQHIIVSSGKPRYRKCTTKLGEQSRMEIFVWTVDRPTESPPDERLRSGEDSTSAIEIAAPGGAGDVAQAKKAHHAGRQVRIEGYMIHIARR